MKTHGEVQAAIDAGKQIEALNVATGEWAHVVDPTAYTPHSLRIKPESKERLECWVDCVDDVTVSGWREPSKGISGLPEVHLREVRPGDMTREEIEEKISYAEPTVGKWTADYFRRIFLGELGHE